MDTTTAGDVNVWRVLGSFVLVLGTMAGSLYWIRRRQGGASGAMRRMKIVERLPLDARRSVVLLEVDGASLVLGVTGEKITLLKDGNGGAAS